MAAKYTSGSVLTVFRLLGTSVPGCIDSTSRTRTTTDARTAMSTDRMTEMDGANE